MTKSYLFKWISSIHFNYFAYRQANYGQKKRKSSFMGTADTPLIINFIDISKRNNLVFYLKSLRKTKCSKFLAQET